VPPTTSLASFAEALSGLGADAWARAVRTWSRDFALPSPSQLATATGNTGEAEGEAQGGHGGGDGHGGGAEGCQRPYSFRVQCRRDKRGSYGFSSRQAECCVAELFDTLALPSLGEGAPWTIDLSAQ
jgi:hypothetical protein